MLFIFDVVYLHLSMFFILLLYLHLIFRLLYHVTSNPLWFLRPVKTFISSELYPEYFLLPFFSSTASATVLSGHFLLTGVFYLTLLPNIFGTSQHFGTACSYQGFPGSRQLFLEICRASYWSSKHRPGSGPIHNLLYILNLYLYLSILQKIYLWWKFW